MNGPLILICGVPADPFIQATVEAARSLSVPHLCLDQNETSNADIEYRYTAHGIDGTLTYDGKIYQLAAVTGVFSRMSEAGTLPAFRKWKWYDKQRHARFHHQLSAWVDLASARVVSPERLMTGDLASSVHLQMIRRFFAVPDSLLTNDGVEARRFVRKHQRVVVKTGPSTTVTGTGPGSEWDLVVARLRHGPVLFQKWIPGADMPVITAGGRCSAFLSAAANQDCGSSGGSAEPVSLPESIADCCIRLAQALKLPWARVNLRFTPDGNYYCLGIDTDPAASYFGAPYGDAIAYSVVKYLAGLS